MELKSKGKMIVYVDALNLYYGLLKNTPYRWLDIYKFVSNVLPRFEIIEIKYFYAELTNKIDPGAPIRQRLYINAMKSSISIECKVTLIEGNFLDDVKKNGIDIYTGKLTSIKTNEEKGTDVNIGVHIIYDTCKRKDFDTICLISNDSDLAEALRLGSIEKKVILLPPISYLTKAQLKEKIKNDERVPYPAGKLKKYADITTRPVKNSILERSQMTENVYDGINIITCPEIRIKEKTP